MRGDVDDFIKLAAGLMAGLFVLAIFWVYASNFISDECWRGVKAPFDEALLGTKSLQTPLGSKDSFSIALNLNSNCLQEILFLHGEYECGDACKQGLNKGEWYQLFHDNKFSSSIVNDCEADCSKYCAGKDCILIMPVPAGMDRAWFDRNKPRVYGSGDYRLQWDKKWDTDTIKPSYGEKCIVFKKLTDGKTYQVTPTSNQGECK